MKQGVQLQHCWLLQATIKFRGRRPKGARQVEVAWRGAAGRGANSMGVQGTMPGRKSQALGCAVITSMCKAAGPQAAKVGQRAWEQDCQPHADSPQGWIGRPQRRLRTALPAAVTAAAAGQLLHSKAASSPGRLTGDGACCRWLLEARGGWCAAKGFGRAATAAARACSRVKAAAAAACCCTHAALDRLRTSRASSSNFNLS